MRSCPVAVRLLPLALVLVGCGGGNGINNGPRAIPADVLARRAIAYSGYRAGQGPDVQVYPSEAQIKEDLQLLVRGHWTFIRLFDCSQHAARVLKVIHDNNFDIKVMSGVWIAGPKAQYDQQNQAEIATCIKLDNEYKDIIVAVSVGNETLDYWSDVRTPVADLVAYIAEVRAKVPQPVTTDDMYLPFTLSVDSCADYSNIWQVAKALDFLSLHVYAFIDAQYDSWDWKQLAVPAGPQRATAMMSAAMDYTKTSIAAANAALVTKGVHLPIIIGEAGWKSTPTDSTDPTEASRAHPVNQKMFYDAIESWVYGSGRDASSPGTVFYFEGYDEPWKMEDDGWGLFDTNRNAKYAVWGAFPDKKPANAPSYSDSDAVYSSN
jgi:exo-beta-1,3-glucanase (GH17 family)